MLLSEYNPVPCTAWSSKLQLIRRSRSDRLPNSWQVFVNALNSISWYQTITRLYLYVCLIALFRNRMYEAYYDVDNCAQSVIQGKPHDLMRDRWAAKMFCSFKHNCAGTHLFFETRYWLTDQLPAFTVTQKLKLRTIGVLINTEMKGLLANKHWGEKIASR